MAVVLPVEAMTISDKLAAMEQLWDSLCRHPSEVPSPPWHGEVLADLEKQVSEGHAKFVEISEMKARVRKAIQ